jgi:Fe-S cluster assembly protein SufD
MGSPAVASTEAAGPSGAAVFPRTFVAVEEGAAATVIELLVSGDEPLLVLPTVELSAGAGARLTHELIQQLGPRAWQIGRLFATAGRDATVASFQASLGGEYARARTDSVLTGRGGSAQLLAAYLGDGKQVHDFRTLQEHAAPQTTSDLVFKGAVGGTSRSVYSGMIRMRNGAKRSNAFQTNRNLVLSDGAHADSVPNLDIQENDVRCSHASAVGPIDEEQRFYLESRGVPREAAERLILLGFFEELSERVSEPVRDLLFASIAGRVRAMTEAGPS